MRAAESVLAEPWLWEALEEHARIIDGKTLVLPVVASERFGRQMIGVGV